MALDVKLDKIGSCPVIVLSGRAVDVDVKKMARRLDSLYRKNVPKMVIDVSNTDFIDSHGLGTVVYFHTLMQKAGRELIVLNTNPNQNSYLHRLFELTHLNKVLNIVSSVKDVLKSAPRPVPHLRQKV